MSRAPSIDKESISPLNPAAPTATPAKNHICHYPPSAPYRSVYLSLRILSVTLAVVQLTQAGVAAGVYGRRRWLDPALSPAIATFFYSGIEVITVLRWQRRAHHLTRVFYDGVLAVGFAVALGFMVVAVTPAIRERREGDAQRAVAALGAGLLASMVGQIVNHLVVCVEGIQDTLRIRKDARREREMVGV